ncbi:MAG: hypothetical protein WAL72_09070 [Streptosporangiaceae bacterium]
MTISRCPSHAPTPRSRRSAIRCWPRHRALADDQTPHERIAAIDDEVLFKVKVQRWRGAVWVDAGISWLVAAGQREEGSPDDFYASLASPLR